MCRSCVYMVPALIHHCACRWPSTICARPSAGTLLIIKLYIFSPKFLWLLAKRVNFSGSLFAINGFINFGWANERFCIYSSFQVLLSVASSCHCLWCSRPGPVFCLQLGVSSDYAQPITGQVTEVTCPVIGRAQPELTTSKRQKTGPGVMP